MSLDPAAFRAHLEAQLELEEGTRGSAYQDSRGYWTIGIGHLVDARLGGRISNAAIDFIFAEDLANVQRSLDQALPWWRGASDAHRLVLADLCFNMGPMRLLGFHHMLECIRNGDGVGAAHELLDSLWAKQVQPSRVTALVNLLKNGDL